MSRAVPATHARAQTYPSKPIRFIVPFPAGGATDAAARAIQPQLEKILGQTVVIENRAGAGAVIGLDAVAKSAPDGYTIGLAPAGAMSVNPAMGVKMPFDVRKDLAADQQSRRDVLHPGGAVDVQGQFACAT